MVGFCTPQMVRLADQLRELNICPYAIDICLFSARVDYILIQLGFCRTTWVLTSLSISAWVSKELGMSNDQSWISTKITKRYLLLWDFVRWQRAFILMIRKSDSFNKMIGPDTFLSLDWCPQPSSTRPAQEFGFRWKEREEQEVGLEVDKGVGGVE